MKYKYLVSLCDVQTFISKPYCVITARSLNGARQQAIKMLYEKDLYNDYTVDVVKITKTDKNTEK